MSFLNKAFTPFCKIPTSSDSSWLSYLASSKLVNNKVSKSLESIPKSTAYLLNIPICFALGLLLAVPFSMFLASIATA